MFNIACIYYSRKQLGEYLYLYFYFVIMIWVSFPSWVLMHWTSSKNVRRFPHLLVLYLQHFKNMTMFDKVLFDKIICLSKTNGNFQFFNKFLFLTNFGICCSCNVEKLCKYRESEFGSKKNRHVCVIQGYTNCPCTSFQRKPNQLWKSVINLMTAIKISLSFSASFLHKNKIFVLLKILFCLAIIILCEMGFPKFTNFCHRQHFHA